MWKRIGHSSAIRLAVPPTTSPALSHSARPPHPPFLLLRTLSSTSGKNSSSKHGDAQRRTKKRHYPQTAAIPREKQQQQTLSNSPSTTANNNKHPHHPKNSKKTLLALNKFMDDLNRIQQRLEHEYDPLPPIWELAHENSSDSDGNREEHFQAAKHVVQEIVKSTGSVSFTHSHELSVLLGRVLKIYAQSCNGSRSTTYYDDAVYILQLMTDWNLELQQEHCDYAIEIAARQGRWHDAAAIFWQHIDPEQSGLRPFDISVTNPVGLYVMVRAAQQVGAAPVKAALEAVLRMCMVSPGDHEKYILAAGTALGLAGEWKALVEYLRTDYDTSELGQPLVAAAMNACLLCGSPDDALQAFDGILGNDFAVADEWQWSGGQDRLNPHCRNLAIRALAYSGRPDASTRAYALFSQARESGTMVSLEALEDIFVAFENEGRWKEAVNAFYCLLAIPREEFLSENTIDEGSLQPVDCHLFRVLESVMRCCNASGQFGLAILSLRIHQVSIHFNRPEISDRTNEDSLLVHALAESICSAAGLSGILVSAMVSLSGLGCHDEALDLYNRISSQSNGALSVEADDVIGAVKLRISSEVAPADVSSWEACYRGIHHISAAASYGIQQANDPFQHAASFSIALGNTINACNLISQPETGFHLLKWLVFPACTDEASVEPMDLFNRTLEITDRLLASIIDSYRLVGNSQHALEMYYSHIRPEAFASPTRILSTIAGVRAMFAFGLHDEAMALFRKTVTEIRSPNLFSVTAKGLLEAGHLAEVEDVYRLALSSNCLSEDLTMTSMQAIDHLRRDTSNRMLLNMVGEVSRLAGSSQTDWLETRYWRLKRLIRRSSLNFLMWWRDRKTDHVDELEYALAMLDSRASLGLAPQNDALRLVANCARNVRRIEIASDNTRINLVPRNKEGWIDVLTNALRESQYSGLVADHEFIGDVVSAYLSLDCHDESIALARAALARGISIDREVLTLISNDERFVSQGDGIVDDITVFLPTNA